MTFPHSIFKAYDIRGIVDQTLTKEITYKIGQAVGSEVIESGGSSIVIGRDGRLSGPMLAESLAQGLRAAGVDVVDIGVAPSPVVYYSSYAKNIPSCIAITGSHNPPDYNGFKMVVDGTTLSAERIQTLKQRILDDSFTQGSGNYTEEKVIESYIERIVSDVIPQRKMKIVIAALTLGMASAMPVSIGARPYWLIDQMRDGELKTDLGKPIVDAFCSDKI